MFSGLLLVIWRPGDPLWFLPKWNQLFPVVAVGRAGSVRTTPLDVPPNADWEIRIYGVITVCAFFGHLSRPVL
jgi:hypothetical protein